MGSEWEEVTVADIAAQERNALVGGPFGSDLVSRDYVSVGVPVIRGQNMGARWISGDFVFVTQNKASSLSANLARPGDLVFTQRGTLGQVAIVPNAPYDYYLISQSQMKLTVNLEKADPLFYYYVFQSNEQQEYVRSHTIQTGVPHTNLGILRSTPVPLPPLPEQRAIAAILGALDDKIELNRRMNGTLEGLARALFRAWFVEFEPVRAKMEGRPTGLAAEIEALFPEALVVGEDGGERPRGWEVASLPEFVEINPSRTLRVGTNAPYLDMANMPTETARATGFRERGFSSGMRFINGDTLVARITPCLENGKTCFVDFLEEGTVGWGSTEYIVLHPRAGLPDEFAYFLARTERFREFAISNMTGTSGRQRVPVSVLEHFMFPVPTIPIAERFGQIARHTLLKMKANDEQSATLAALRDELLPRLMRGEVRVSNLENVFGVV